MLGSAARVLRLLAFPCLLAALALCLLGLLTAKAQTGGGGAAVTLDIYTVVPLRDNPSAASYELAISDCTRVVSLDIDQGGSTRTLATSDFTRQPGSSSACSARFELSGARLLQPAVNLHFNDGSAQSYSESFAIEQAQPELTFEGVALTNVAGEQHLDVTVTAHDDVDLSAVTFDVVGLTASDLRAVGGVVEAARRNAFAKLLAPERVRPTRDGQTEFSVSIPVTTRLTADQIAHDGVVMLDVAALDASGNETRISRIAFTGGDVQEEVLGLHANPSRILFTSLLESATVIPTVDFQFRGPTALPGLGTGATYESSHPNLVAVSRAGVVTPIAETGNSQVFITVGYPGASSVQVPVEVNQSRHLVRLETGEPASGTFPLQRLNTWYALPPVFGVFDDGSRLPVTDQFPRDVTLEPAASGLLSYDPKRGLNAAAIIPPEAPLKVTLSLHNQPEIKATLQVTARDGAPEIRLFCPAVVHPGEELKVSALPKDDVGVAKVEFLLNGGVLSDRSAAPYEVSLQISEQSLNQVLPIQARVWDTTGQSIDSDVCETRVLAQPEVTVPHLDFESPLPLQRVVESRGLRLQMGTFVEDGKSSGVNYVEFFIDGSLVGESRFPLYERDPATGALHEIWRYDTIAPEIASHESSRAAYAVVHAGLGSAQSESRLFRIIEDTQPSVSIVSPLSGEGVSVGQTVSVVIEVKDDTLGAGLDSRLLLDEQVFAEHRFLDETRKFADATTQQIDRYTYTLPVDAAMLGRQLSLRVSVIDQAGQVSESDTVNVVVRSDQPPGIAISSPVEGSHQIGGLPLELR
ncbi:MAG TPA: Ig-like domain-containing protein, partial [Polyangiaceae bacterium]|nr:Ig-like domain-containing protein [Polyangiaceae bacterium]